MIANLLAVTAALDLSAHIVTGYGKWLPMADRGAVNALDDTIRWQVVAKR
jgi:hypothetical protein